MTLAAVLSPESSCKQSCREETSAAIAAAMVTSWKLHFCPYFTWTHLDIAAVSVSRCTWLLTLKSPGNIGFSGQTDMGPGPTSSWLISSATALATVLISLLLSVCLTTYLLSRQWDGALTAATFSFVSLLWRLSCLSVVAQVGVWGNYPSIYVSFYLNHLKYYP